jgi:hypothetical protein
MSISPQWSVVSGQWSVVSGQWSGRVWGVSVSSSFSSIFRERWRRVAKVLQAFPFSDVQLFSSGSFSRIESELEAQT